jgi:hypothetical protein
MGNRTAGRIWVAGSFAAALVVVQMTWPVLTESVGLPLLALCAVGAFVGAFLFFSPEERKPANAASGTPTLPITVTELRLLFYSRHSGLQKRVTMRDGTLTVEPPIIQTIPVFISNTSTTRAVTLRIYLMIEDGKGGSAKIHGDGIDSWGQQIGTHDIASRSIFNRSRVPDKLLLSPIHLPPQSTADGKLCFVPTWVDLNSDDEATKRRSDWFLKGVTSVASGYSLSIEIEDVTSQTVIRLRMPSEGYRGAP